ncbi:MAG: site-specific integrase, partial [bacterium]|nr:site-specific integrase [bacterium]
AGQVRALIENSPDEWRTFFLTAGLTGMRLGELLAMRWKNVDWKAGCYNVRERLYERLFDTPKSESSLRAVDLAASALAALKAHRAEQNRVKLMLGPDYEDADLVFCQPGGKPITNPRSIRKVLQKVLVAAGCPSIRIHDLRHSYASALIVQGAHPRYIQKQLGHASISITMDVYGHLFPEMGQEMAQKIETHFFGAV